MGAYTDTTASECDFTGVTLFKGGSIRIERDVRENNISGSSRSSQEVEGQCGILRDADIWAIEHESPVATERHLNGKEYRSCE
jgi:hypothetical protein